MEINKNTSIKPSETFQVTDSQLQEALFNVIKDMDADSLADVAQHVLGGAIYPPAENDTYTIETNETYFGALDKYKK